METALQPWVIQLKNVVLGRALLFILYLPEGWQLRRGFAHPEIHGMQRIREMYWVTSADAHYLLTHEEGYGLEFQVRVRPDTGAYAAQGAGVRIQGHAVEVQRDTVRRGPPWRRRQVPRMVLRWSCPETRRKLRMEVVGVMPEARFQELLEAFTHLRCHHIPGTSLEGEV